MTISVNSEKHNNIIEIGERIRWSTSDLMNLDTPPTMGMIRVICEQLKRFTSDLESELEQPKSLIGCECARWENENHEGRCSGADCNCHG